jgi:hypothetical protein
MISKLNINLTNYYPEAQFKITKKKLRETFEKQQKEAEGKREN